MGKSVKKSKLEVSANPMVVSQAKTDKKGIPSLIFHQPNAIYLVPVIPANEPLCQVDASENGGNKRAAEEVIEKLANSKKQKKEVENVVQNMKNGKKTKMILEAAIKKKPESSSSDDSSSESKEEVKAAVKKTKPVKPPVSESSSDSSDESSSDEEPVSKTSALSKKQAVPVSKNGSVGTLTKKSAKPASSSDSESDSDDDEEPAAKVSRSVKNGPSVISKKSQESSDSSDSDSSSDEDDKKVTVQTKRASPAVSQKKVESSDSSETDSSSEEEDKKVAVQQKKATTAVVQRKVESSDSSSESESEDKVTGGVPSKGSMVKAEAKQTAILKKDDADSDDESSDDSSDEEPKVKKIKVNAKVESISEDEESSEESSEEEPKAQEKKSTKAPTENSSSDEDSSEEESEDEKPMKTPKKIEDVEMKDASSTKTEIPKASEKKAPKTPVTPSSQATGSKTLFVGNLSFKVEQTDVEEFFKSVGEVVDVRFAIDQDGRFRGFGHVEFASEEAANQALQLNGEDLLGRAVRLDLAREKGAYTPNSSKENSSYQKGGKNEPGQTIFIRGFDRSLGEEEVRSSLEEHFGSCGEIKRISIPKDYDTGAPKGLAYVEFTEGDSFSKALDLNGSELSGYNLTVEEARPRSDSRDGGGGGRGGGRSGGRNDSGRFGGRRGGARGGGGGRFGGGRGRGTPNKPSMGTPGTGKKTTFGED